MVNDNEEGSMNIPDIDDMIPLTGADLIEYERLRQRAVEGWTSEHDAEHVQGELVDAAIDYARFAAILLRDPTASEVSEFIAGPSDNWPWHPDWWKPSPDDPVRNLVKAGALIAAEIDRILAAAQNDA